MFYKHHSSLVYYYLEILSMFKGRLFKLPIHLHRYVDRSQFDYYSAGYYSIRGPVLDQKYACLINSRSDMHSSV